MDLSAAFGLPPEDAIAFFEAKGYKITWDWHESWQAINDRSFTVAKVLRADVLQDIRDGVQAVLDRGETERWFTDRLTPVLQAKGWWGRKIVVGADGQAEVVQEGSARRLQTIFRTNVQTAYAAGRWNRFIANAGDRPYLQYVAVMDGRTRPGHARLNGKVFRIDDPIWQIIAPPNGFNCRCAVRALSQADVDRLGLKVEYDARIETRQVDAKPFINKRTGELDPTRLTQRGVSIPDPLRPGKRITLWTDSGWDYNPGESVSGGMSRLVAQKLQTLDAPLGATLFDASRAKIIAEQGAVYRDWLSRVALDATAKSQTPTIGAIDLADLHWLRDNDKPLPMTAEIGISSSVIDGPKAIRHADKGDAIPMAIWERLPEMLIEPLAVLYDTVRKTLLYILPEATVRRPQLVVEFDYLRRAAVGKNMIVSGYRPLLHNLKQREQDGSLILIRGSLK